MGQYQGTVVEGNKVTVGGAWMQAATAWRIVDETRTQCLVWVYETLWVGSSGTNGFGGTDMDYITNYGGSGKADVWASSIPFCTGAGEATEEGGWDEPNYKSIGWVDRGTQISLKCDVSYTGGSGTTYQTTSTQTFTVPTTLVTKNGAVYVYDSSGKPKMTDTLYIYDSSGARKRASSISVYTENGIRTVNL